MPEERESDDLPTWRAQITLQGSETYNRGIQRTAIAPGTAQEIWDVKFCPFVPPNEDPIFAIVGTRSVTICRAVANGDTAFEILRVFVDEDKNSQVVHNSVAWVQDPDTGEPLVIVSGALPKIQLLNVATGKLHRTIIGHGADINDIAISPTSPSTMATCSQDHSIRLWNLKSKYAKFPCSAICHGHKASVISIDFHQSGRYLISGGYDTYVNLWILPGKDELEQLPRIPEDGREEAKMIHSPQFSTAELHSNYVDCVKFYGDLIFSRAAHEEQILLWKIHGFNSSQPPPTAAPPTANKTVLTSSAFGTGFQRLMQFDISASLVWMRFSIYNSPGKHPILAAGDNYGEIFFWDLQKLESKGDKYHGDAFENVQPHGSAKSGKTKVMDYVRAVTWSPCGRWCVVGLDRGRVVMCSRWLVKLYDTERKKELKAGNSGKKKAR